MKVNKILTDKNIELMINNAKATLAVDGFIVTEAETNVARRFIKGDITEKEALKMIMEV